MLILWLRMNHPYGSIAYFDRAETGLKTIAAVHGQCPLRVDTVEKGLALIGEQ
jgi:hypothetical protein